jgi:hypothetical protein
MTAHYNNNGHQARYACVAMKSNYGQPPCPIARCGAVDALMTRLALQALEPAAPEASLALATGLQAERAALDLHWQQRLERGAYEVERARRQYDACDLRTDW